MRREFWIVVVAMVGIVVGLVTTAYAQTSTGKITATGGWNICVDAPGVTTLAAAQAIAVTVKYDGASAVPASGVVWVAPVAPATSVEAQLPLSQMPASARTVGVHTVEIAFAGTTGSPVILADGSTLTPSPGTPLLLSYEVVAQPTGPSPTNPRWKKIAGTLALAMVGLWMLFRG